MTKTKTKTMFERVRVRGGRGSEGCINTDREMGRGEG